MPTLATRAGMDRFFVQRRKRSVAESVRIMVEWAALRRSASPARIVELIVERRAAGVDDWSCQGEPELLDHASGSSVLPMHACVNAQHIERAERVRDQSASCFGREATPPL